MAKAKTKVELTEEEILELVEARKREIELDLLRESMNNKLDRLLKQADAAGLVIRKRDTIGGAYDRYEFRKSYRLMRD